MPAELPKGDEVRAARLANLRRLQELGYEPYGGAFERTGRLADVRAQFAEGRSVRIAGRVVSRRDMGKAVFAHLQDGSGRFQVYVKRDVVGDRAFEAFGHLDLGDHIGVEGELFTTRTGEPTVRVTSWALLAKALRALPEKWHGLRETELRYRQRYLDLIANPDVRELFYRRAAVLQAIRAFLSQRGFIEVETPMLQATPGGAAATPFVTHYKALGQDMYLRIAPELYLKQLLVGGLDKVFELNRNFRNEGLDRAHNPEFTMLEVYEAYADVRAMMRLVQDLILHVAQAVFRTLRVGEGDAAVDLTPPWPEVTYRELIRREMGDDWFELPVAAARERARARGLVVADEWTPTEITHEVYEKLVERRIGNPVFVTRFPADLIPLAKRCADDPTVVDVFELVIRGMEIAPAYSELNDPQEQRRRFEAQAAGHAQRVDEDFLLALEHGMPPAGGLGLGVDRLMMVLAGVHSIREVILFPQLRAKE